MVLNIFFMSPALVMLLKACCVALFGVLIFIQQIPNPGYGKINLAE